MPAFFTPWRAVSAMFVLNGAFLGIWASRIPTIREAQGLDKSKFGLLLLVSDHAPQTLAAVTEASSVATLKISLDGQIGVCAVSEIATAACAVSPIPSGNEHILR